MVESLDILAMSLDQTISASMYEGLSNISHAKLSAFSKLRYEHISRKHFHPSIKETQEKLEGELPQLAPPDISLILRKASFADCFTSKGRNAM